MKGETAELCRLTVAAKYALRNGGKFNYTKDKYVNSEIFSFSPRRMSILPVKKTHRVRSAEEWFNHLLSLGVRDIFMLLPADKGSFAIHGFSGTNVGCIKCFFESGEITYFSPNWSFDNKLKMWNIEYIEPEWRNLPINPAKEPPRFSDNTTEFFKTLTEIAELADQIDEKYWADIFRSAREILNGNSDCEKKELPDLPEHNLRLYEAADKSDVFGAMGSWNDSPRWYAEEKGLIDEYVELSNKLFIQIQEALMFAVNEF